MLKITTGLILAIHLGRVFESLLLEKKMKMKHHYKQVFFELHTF